MMEPLAREPLPDFAVFDFPRSLPMTGHPITDPKRTFPRLFLKVCNFPDGSDFVELKDGRDLRQQPSVIEYPTMGHQASHGRILPDILKAIRTGTPLPRHLAKPGFGLSAYPEEDPKNPGRFKENRMWRK